MFIWVRKKSVQNDGIIFQNLATIWAAMKSRIDPNSFPFFGTNQPPAECLIQKRRNSTLGNKTEKPHT